MKRFLLFSVLTAHFCLFFVSCSDISYTNKDRVLFEGYVKQQDGAPIKNIPVYIYVYKGSDSDNISYTTTDANGYYRMIFPKPDRFDDITLTINTFDNIYEENTPHLIDSSYSNYTIKNILTTDLNGLHRDFGTTVLYSHYETTTLTINFITEGNVSWNFPITAYEGLFANEGRYYSPPESEYEPFPGDPNNDTYFDYYPNSEGLKYYTYYWQGNTYYRTFTVIKNQNMIFKYRNAENNIITVNIPIAEEPVTYTVNY